MNYISLLGALLLFALGWMVHFFRARVYLQQKEHHIALLQQQIDSMQKSDQTMKEQFQYISSEMLAKSQQNFLRLATSQLETIHEKNKGAFEKKSDEFTQLIKPVKESLDKVDAKIMALENTRLSAYTALNEQVNLLITSQKELRQETGKLGKALRTPSVRGRWGEIQLKRVVEMAGMLNYCDFYEQTHVTTAEGRFRPDLLVKLPGNKNIVVDAKAPLEAYLAAIDCESERDKEHMLKEHASRIRAHINLLSKKSYWEQFQPAPEFVVLFLPGETFFSAALENDPSLIELGVDKQVILATPTTLIALLRAVSYGWRQESLSKNAEQISVLGRELYKRLSDMSSHFNKVGKSLSGAVVAYNKAVGSLESRVLATARRFEDMDQIEAAQKMEPVEQIEQSTRLLQAVELQEEI